MKKMKTIALASAMAFSMLLAGCSSATPKSDAKKVSAAEKTTESQKTETKKNANKEAAKDFDLSKIKNWKRELVIVEGADPTAYLVDSLDYDDQEITAITVDTSKADFGKKGDYEVYFFITPKGADDAVEEEVPAEVITEEEVEERSKDGTEIITQDIIDTFYQAKGSAGTNAQGGVNATGEAAKSPDTSVR